MSGLLNEEYSITPSDFKSTFIREKTIEILNNMTDNDFTDIRYVANKVYSDVVDAIRAFDTKWRIPDNLYPYQIAEIILKSKRIIRIALSGLDVDEKNDILGIYKDTDLDSNIGTYSISDVDITRFIHTIAACNIANTNKIKKYLFTHLPRTTVCNNPDLIPVNNGIFNYKTKKLMSFNPKYVFLYKIGTNYNPQATNITIKQDAYNIDWNIEDWIKALSGNNDEKTELLWKIIGAATRRETFWNKMIIIYSCLYPEADGKYTYLELLNNLLGNAAMNMSYYGYKDDMDFYTCIKKTAIISDNDLHGYNNFDIKKANQKCKSILKQDIIKNKNSKWKILEARIKTLMIHFFYEKPDIQPEYKDFFEKHQITIPFENAFDKQQLGYIRNICVKNKDVLEYVLYKVLNTDYYTLE